MGKIQVLTKEQETILGEIAKIKFFKNNFYFTGGTALSELYLQHRYSEDLDFFSQERFDNQIILSLMEDLGKKLKFEIQAEFKEVVYVFYLTFKNKVKLKVDFGYYPYRKLGQEELFNGFKVDSLTDIAVNKLHTIVQRTDVKDFVDLYFLLKKFTFWDLVEGIRPKFGMRVEPFTFAGDFLKVEDFEYLPRMIKPLELDELRRFFREKAKQLGHSVVDK